MFEKIEARLVEDWRQAHKMLSVWAAALIAALAEAQDQLPIVREYMPEGWVKYAAALVIFARLYRQSKPKV